MLSAKAPRRILHITPSFFPAHGYGGPVTSLYELCRAQLQAGLSVRVLTSDAGLERVPDPHDVPTYYARASIGEDIAPELLLQLPVELAWCELVHVTGVWSTTSLLGLLAAAGAFGIKRPCVLSPRGALLPWALRRRGRAKQLVLRLLAPLLRRVAGWHATSSEEAAAITTLRRPGLIGARAPIAVVPNGVWLPKPDAAPAGPALHPSIVALGRVHPIKNLELAIAALAELRRTVPQATLLIIGPERGDYGDRLRSHAAALELDLHRAVCFLGQKTGEDKLRILRSAAVLWLCSHMESFGNVVLEALAAGTPVVAAQTTPWPILDEIGGGHWVAPSPTSFARATAALLREQATAADRAAVARRCQAAVAERFAWPTVEVAMRSLYQQSLQE